MTLSKLKIILFLFQNLFIFFFWLCIHDSNRRNVTFFPPSTFYTSLAWTWIIKKALCLFYVRFLWFYMVTSSNISIYIDFSSIQPTIKTKTRLRPYATLKTPNPELTLRLFFVHSSFLRRTICSEIVGSRFSPFFFYLTLNKLLTYRPWVIAILFFFLFFSTFQDSRLEMNGSKHVSNKKRIERGQDGDLLYKCPFRKESVYNFGWRSCIKLCIVVRSATKLHDNVARSQINLSEYVREFL